jgi:sarcosine oxidase, subunit gamma
MVEFAAYVGAGFRLDGSPAGHILQALSREFRADLAAPLAGIAEAAPFSVRRAGPESWFLVGDAELSAADVARKGEAIANFAWLVDQTHGRCRFVISGPESERRLATGIGANLSLRHFDVGAAAEMQYAAIGLHLARTASDRFEILVGRSFAESLWNDLSA